MKTLYLNYLDKLIRLICELVDLQFYFALHCLKRLTNKCLFSFVSQPSDPVKTINQLNNQYSQTPLARTTILYNREYII